MEATYFCGESYPNICPNIGPDILGAILGCDLQLGVDTSWAKYLITDWDNVKELKFDRDNKWWKKIKAMTEEIVNDSKGDYIVGVTDLLYSDSPLPFGQYRLASCFL